MAVSQSLEQVRAMPSKDAYPASSRMLDLLVCACGIWFVFGLYLDGWAHNQRLVDSFFTPWHAVLYSGFLAVALTIGITQVRNMWHGYSMMRALPKGYLLSLVGIVMFALAAPFDLLWHEVFGFEENIEALLSPSHLLLATGAILAVGGPLRSAIRRSRSRTLQGWRDLLPVVLSLFLLYAVISFFTQYAHPLANHHLMVRRVNIEPFFTDIQGIFSAFLPTIMLMCLIFLGLRFWQLPFGTVTLLLGGGMAAFYLMRIRAASGFWYIVLIAFVVGLLADGFIARFKPSINHVRALRWLAFGLPFGFFLSVYVADILLRGMVWKIHMWLGVSILCGVLGLGLSYIFAPPFQHLPDDRD